MHDMTFQIEIIADFDCLYILNKSGREFQNFQNFQNLSIILINKYLRHVNTYRYIV